MTRNHGVTRRAVLVGAGSGVLGLAIVNTVSGCSSSNAPAAPATGTPLPTVADNIVAGDWRRADLGYVSTYLLVRGDEIAVVDLGVQGSSLPIQMGLRAAGKDWPAVKHVILTHSHSDHIGGLHEITPNIAGATVYAGPGDAPSINSSKKITWAEDGDEIFGLRIIATPGHTAGHISVFDPSTGVLVAGDALRHNAGLNGSDPRYTEDEAQAVASVKALAELDVKAILPGHGDPIIEGAREELQKLAASL